MSTWTNETLITGICAHYNSDDEYIMTREKLPTELHYE